MIELKQVSRVSSELVQIVVTVDAKLWQKHKKNGQLGSLYGVDISNLVYRATGVKAYYPSVSDKTRAKNGLKVIFLTYVDPDWRPMSNLIPVDFVNRCRAA